MDKKLIIVCHPVYGGSGIVATELGMALANRGYQVHFISHEMPVKLVAYHPNIFFHEVKAFDYPLFSFPMYEGALASCIMDVVLNQNVSLVHTHYAIPFAYVALWVKQLLYAQYQRKIKVVTTLHGTDITIIGKDKAYQPILEFSVNSADRVTCVSQYLKEEMYKVVNVKNDIEVIYNFIDTQNDRRRLPKNIETIKKVLCNENDIVISHISNFRKVKRTDDVIHIFHRILKTQPNATLLMVGDGPERYEAESLCRKFNICHKVKFLGKMQEVEKILNISDLFLLPSQNESFGLVALEALSIGVPVIATDIGGIPEVVEDGKNGFLHPLGDVDAMAASALRLLASNELYQSFSNAAIERARIFDKERVVSLYEKMYHEA